MTSRSSHRSLRFSVVSFFRNHYAAASLVFLLTMLTSGARAVTATTTALAISSASVPYKTPITLTATVTTTTDGSAVSAGLVLFCDATAPHCENNSALGLVQLTATTATAVVKIGSGPLGTHSYKAVYIANNLYSASVSKTVSYEVQGTYATTTTALASGNVGNYTLLGTVTGVGSLLAGPTGNISFIDTSAGNKIVGTQALGTAALNETFTEAPGSPFSIALAPSQNSTATRSVAIASDYIDGDNNLDVVTANTDQTVTVLFGNGDGSFQQKVNYTGCLTGDPVKILLADFNRDGNTDIALGCSTGYHGGLAILLGKANGKFQPAVYYSSGDVEGLAMGDFNNDGILDIVVTNRSQNNVTTFIGNGDGTFQAASVALNTPRPAYDVVVADFDGDGNDDVAYAVAASSGDLSDLYLALGNGNGTFQTPVVAASNIGEFLTTGDTNGDNIPDIVSATVQMAHENGNTNIGKSLFVIIGKGKGAFQPPVSYLSDIPSDPHLADVNGDGKPDIIAGGSYGVLVYLGNGDGTFQGYSEPVMGGPTLSSAFALTYAVYAGDYNNDGNADLVGTDANNYQAAVSLSEVQQTADASALTGLALFPLGSGTHYVDASYPGNSIFLNSVSSTFPLLAAPAPTTLSLAVSPTAATLAGQSLTLTATLAPYSAGPPNTTTDGESVLFFNGSHYLGSGTLTSGVAQFTTTTLPPGSDTLQAAYPGEANYEPSSSSSVNVTVASIVLTSSLNPSTYGQSVTFVATVPSGEQGTVTFSDGGTALKTVNLSGTTTASFTTSTLTAVSHNITATYNGDSSHPAATSPILTQVVNVATTSLAVTTSGASVYGDSVLITATLASGTTGSVVFTSGSTPLGTGAINSSGFATVSTSLLPAGTDPISASYSGDTNYNAATGSTTQTVAQRTPTTNLTSSANPSVPGAPVTFTDSLPTGLSGTVTFTNGTTSLGTFPVTSGTATLKTSSLPLGSDPITATYNGDPNNKSVAATLTQTVAKLTPVITVTVPGSSIYGASVPIAVSLSTSATGTVTITSNGITLGSGSASSPFTITTTSLPAGNNVITASYPGDNTNNAATGTANQTVSQAPSTLALTSSPNPSLVNQSVTFTATLPVNASGSVTFTYGTTTLGTSPIVNGVARSPLTSTLPAGSDLINASYNGDSNYGASSGSTTQTVNKANSALTVTTSGPSTYGNPVQITVTVPSGATGSVTITAGGTTTTVPVNSTGTAVVTTSSLPVGNDPINATYSGDQSNSSSSGTTTQVVSKIAPTVTLGSSVNPSNVNQSVTFTATVPTTATGTITFYDGSTVLAATVPVTNGQATTITSTLSAGPHTILATYNGDTDNNSASSAPLAQTVNKLTPVLPPPSVSPTNTTAGNQVTITESVPPGVTTGPVTFYNGTTPIGSAPIINGASTITITTLPVGTDPITATTPADANNNSATSPATVVTVTKATPTIGLSSSVNPSTAGQSVLFTATAPTAATGSITFYDGPTAIGTSNLSNGQATITANSLTTGSHTITATYSGDPSYSAANSAPLIQTVTKASPTLPPPAVSATTSTFGSSETISETIPPGVTGPVTFYNGSTPIGTAPIVNGVATITTTTLPLGTDLITATTPGDANNNAATSPATSVTVTKFTPTLPPPAVSTATPPPDTPVTITEQVPSGTTGPVTFSDGGTVIGTAPVVGGVATITVPSLPLGPNPITATVPATPGSNSATSPATQVVVSKITPTVVLSSSANPAQINQPVVFTAAVPSAASGSVTFYDGSVVLGTAAVNAAGIASLTTSNLTTGSHTITATYGGNSSYATATSTPLAQTIGKIPTAVALSPSAPTQLLHNSVTFAATVSAASPTPTGTVTFLEGTTVLGTVALNTNSTVVALAKSANAAYATNSLTTGSHQIVAVYSGDASFASSTSAPVTYIVQDFTNTLNGTASQNLFPGDKTSYTFDLTPLGATTFLSDLNLTVTGLPPGSTYTFTPATIAAGSATTSVVLNVVTSSSLSAQNRLPGNDSKSHSGLPIAMGILGLFGLGAVRKYGRRMPRTLMLLLLLLGSLLPIAGLSGCAGGYFTLTPTTYSVNVTGIEGSIQHTATATLVVQ